LSKLVILGRDGVINYDPGHAIASPDDWVPIPGSLEAIARLSQVGYRVAIASNQPGLAQGLLDLDVLNAIHHKLHDLLDRLGGHVVAIAFCPHAPHEACDCRKPATGLYKQLAERFGVSLESVTVIGSQHADMVAAASIGAKPMMVMTSHDSQAISDFGEDQIPCFADLAHAASALLVEE